MPDRFSFASAGLRQAGETFDKMHRRYYAMMLYRLWVDTFGLLDEAAAAELTARADRIEAEYRDPLKTIAAKMTRVRSMLDSSDSGPANQQTQQEILEQLDDLIALMEEQQEPDEPEARRRQEPNKALGPRRAPQERRPAPRDPPADGKKIRPSDLGGAWGLLPAKERERLVATFTGSIPERYHNMIRDYFARVARGRSRPAEAAGSDRD